MPIQDLEQREQALNPGQSFAVSAPAGSGKTELLTRRVLKLLACVDNPEEILCITFTRKAANEMRGRIIAALKHASDAQPPSSPHDRVTWQLARDALVRDHDYSWQLLDNPGRLGIQTIDGFCMQLARSLPVTAGIGSEPRISEHPEKLYQQAVRSLFKRISANPAGHSHLQTLLPHFDGNTERVENLLCRLLANRDQWLRLVIGNNRDMQAFRDYLETVLLQLHRETLTLVQDLLMPHERDIVALANSAAQAMFEQGNLPSHPVPLNSLPGIEPQELPRWRLITDWLLTKQDSWRKSLTKNEGFPSATREPEKSERQQTKAAALALIATLRDQPHTLDALSDLRALPPITFDPIQWRLLEALGELLPALAAELLLAFHEQGEVDYVQVTTAALDALGHDELPSDQALMLDYRLNHILVDEFQDTSSSQYQLLTRLTEAWTPGDGRTLFIVGDGMQSCYGFRDANVGLFLVAREFGIGGAQLQNLDLVSNFRSTKHVIGWVNRVFADAFPAYDDISHGAVSYRTSHAASESRNASESTPESAVETLVCTNDPERVEESAQVVRLVQETLSQSATDTIAILVRNRNHLNRIIPALQAACISWQAVDIASLAQRPIISDVLALTRALINPADDIAWLALLRSPVCGLTLHDLHVLMTRSPASNNQSPVLWDRINNPEVIKNLSNDGQARITRMLMTLRPAIDYRGRLPLRSWLEHAWLSLGGPNQAYPETDLEQLQGYWELLEIAGRGGDLVDMAGFEAEVTRLYARPAGDTSARVHIMTMHKSKGLEFDHVILPGLDRSSRAPEPEMMVWYERIAGDGATHLLLSPIAERGADKDPVYQYIRREQGIREQLEDTRLLYVACTRAIKRLNLLGCSEYGADETTLKPPAKNALLSRIWSTVEPEVQVMVATPEPLPETSPAGGIKRLQIANTGT